jgi:hypothetical protein
MPLRKIARIVRAASTDAELARRTAHSPEFRRALTSDRRSALSEYATVKHALRDRERLEKRGRPPGAQTEAPKRRGRAPGRERGVPPSERRN